MVFGVELGGFLDYPIDCEQGRGLRICFNLRSGDYMALLSSIRQLSGSWLLD
jgi:hypothetical protein